MSGNFSTFKPDVSSYVLNTVLVVWSVIPGQLNEEWKNGVPYKENVSKIGKDELNGSGQTNVV